jgi:hypothetical protein
VVICNAELRGKWVSIQKSSRIDGLSHHCVGHYTKPKSPSKWAPKNVRVCTDTSSVTAHPSRKDCRVAPLAFAGCLDVIIPAIILAIIWVVICMSQFIITTVRRANKAARIGGDCNGSISNPGSLQHANATRQAMMGAEASPLGNLWQKASGMS